MQSINLLMLRYTSGTPQAMPQALFHMEAMLKCMSDNLDATNDAAERIQASRPHAIGGRSYLLVSKTFHNRSVSSCDSVLSPHASFTIDAKSFRLMPAACRNHVMHDVVVLVGTVAHLREKRDGLTSAANSKLTSWRRLHEGSQSHEHAM